ncbi:MAG: DUF2585 family protein [Rubripirellula sp.]
MTKPRSCYYAQMKSLSKRQLFFFLTITLSITVIVLRSLGRTFWCDCGGFSPWSWDIWSTHNSQHLLDPYFFSHVLHGVLFFAVLYVLRKWVSDNARWLIAIAIESGWEILENSPFIIDRYRAATISLDYYGDSIANSIFDIIACAIGYWITSQLRWYWSVAIFVVVELLLLATIRDCLILNVIMLVSPIDALRDWQMAAQ